MRSSRNARQSARSSRMPSISVDSVNEEKRTTDPASGRYCRSRKASPRSCWCRRGRSEGSSANVASPRRRALDRTVLEWASMSSMITNPKEQRQPNPPIPMIKSFLLELAGKGEGSARATTESSPSFSDCKLRSAPSWRSSWTRSASELSSFLVSRSISPLRPSRRTRLSRRLLTCS